MDHLKEPVNLKSKKHLVSIFVTLFILVAIPLTVFVALNARSFNPKAAGPGLSDKEKKELRIGKAKQGVKFTNDVIVNTVEGFKRNPADKGAAQKELAKLSKQRKEDLKLLFEEDPKAAAELILPEAALTEMNSIAGAQIEAKVSLKGTYGVFHTDDFKNNTSQTDYYLTVSKKRYKLTSANKLPEVSSGPGNLDVEGYQIDNQVLTTSVKNNGSALAAFFPDQAAAKNSKVLGAWTPSGYPPTTVGNINTAVIVVNYTGVSNPTLSVDEVKTTIQGRPGNDVASYYKEATYGKANLVFSYFGPYTLPVSVLTDGCSGGNAGTKAVLQAANADINFLNYKRLLLVQNCDSYASAGTIGEVSLPTPDGTAVTGLAWIAAGGVGTRVDLGFYNHELGHTMGFPHSNRLDCSPDAVTTQHYIEPWCRIYEYGDYYNAMGSGQPTSHAVWPLTGSRVSGHFDANYKVAAGWLTSSNYISVSAPGTYTYKLSPLETASTGPVALSVKRANGSEWTVQYRQPLGFDSWMADSGVCFRCNVTSGAWIKLGTLGVDTSPLSGANDFYNGALLPGKTFTDPDFGTTITTVAADTSGLTVTVVIPTTNTCVRGTPSTTLSPTSLTAAPGETKTFTVTVKNNDSATCPVTEFGPPLPYRNFGEPDAHTNYSPTYLNLAPGASGVMTATVKVSTSAVILNGGGLGHAIINDASGQSGSGAVTLYIVAPDDSIPPTAPTNLTVTAPGAKTVKLSWGASTDNVRVAGYNIFRNSVIIANITTTSFSDYNVTASTPYSYYVQAYDFYRYRQVSPSSNTVTVTTPAQTDFEYVSLVKNVTADPIDNYSVKLTWGPSTDNVGIDHYAIWRSYFDTYTGTQSYPLSQLSPVGIVDGNTTSFVDTYLTPGQNYEYAIEPFDADGNRYGGGDYNPLQYETESFLRWVWLPRDGGSTPPASPTNLVANPVSYNQIDLSWTKSNSTNVAGYDILVRDPSPFIKKDKKIGSVDANTAAFTDTRVFGNGRDYYVQARDSVGSLSYPSNMAITKAPYGQLSTINPTVTTNLINGSTVSGQVTVTSVVTAANGIRDVTYTINGGANLYGNLAKFESDPTSFVWDTTKFPNGSYSFGISVVDKAGLTGGNGATVTINNVSSGDITPPVVNITSPTNGATVSGTVALSATATDDVGVTKTEFFVDGALASTATTSPYSFSWNTTSVSNGAHLLAAKAYDAAGNTSSSSISVNVANGTGGDTTPPSVPGTPTTTSVLYNKVALSWTASTDNVSVTGYYVIRNGVTIATSPINSYSDTTVSASTVYSYQVTAFDAAANNSAASGTKSVTTPAVSDLTAPTVPTNLVATAAGYNQVNLSWTASTDDIGVVSYDVYRNGSRVAQKVVGTSYGDATVKASTAYSYFIKARDASGKVSSASNTATATTSVLPTDKGDLTGTVTSSAGGVVSGATLTLYVNGSRKSYKTTTLGVYNATLLPVSTYKLTITKSGFTTQTVNVTLTANTTSTKDIVLQKL